MAKHFPAPWVDGNPSDAIVTKTMPEGYNNTTLIEEYGGYLIAETVSPCNKPLIKAAPRMLALLEKALPMIEEEASRREYAPVEDGEGIGGYWTEMRELANEISAEIYRAHTGKEPEPDLCPHGFGFVEYCPDCKRGKGVSDVV